MKPSLSFRASPRVKETAPETRRSLDCPRDDNEQAATGTSEEADEQEQERKQFELLKEKMTRTS